MAGAKFRSGGARVGCAKLRKIGSVRWRREQRQLRKGGGKASSLPVVKREPVEMPADMPAEQRAVWASLAPHAVAAGTLTAATAFAFKLLCAQIVLMQDMAALIKKKGLTTLALDTKMEAAGGGSQLIQEKANPLLARHDAVFKDVQAGLARFLLNGTGKPAAVQAPPEDAFAEFDQGFGVIQGGKRP